MPLLRSRIVGENDPIPEGYRQTGTAQKVGGLLRRILEPIEEQAQNAGGMEQASMEQAQNALPPGFAERQKFEDSIRNKYGNPWEDERGLDAKVKSQMEDARDGLFKHVFGGSFKNNASDKAYWANAQNQYSKYLAEKLKSDIDQRKQRVANDLKAYDAYSGRKEGGISDYQQAQLGKDRFEALNKWKENNPPPVEPESGGWKFDSTIKKEQAEYKQALAEYKKKEDAFLSEYDSAVSGKSTEKESDLQSLIKAAGAGGTKGTKAAPDSAPSSPKTTQVTEKVSRKALAKPVKLAKTMKDLEGMIPPREVSQQGIYKSDIPYPWETSDPLGRVGEFVSENITGRTQVTQEARLPRKGEVEITTALRVRKIGGKGLKGLSERNFLSMKLKAVYGKSMTDKQIADAILDGTLLGDK
ncbi:MAG: hypothetical protein ABIB71_07940 [Candidatus Woesearchaeota archaeon]